MAYRKNNKLLPRARQMRGNMTPQERKLWYAFLKDCPVRVYKQRIIGQYIVDFYCYTAKLVIEVDGAQHDTTGGVGYDAERTAWLEAVGLKVLRFTNYEIDCCFARVCQIIREEIEHRQAGG